MAAAMTMCPNQLSVVVALPHLTSHSSGCYREPFPCPLSFRWPHHLRRVLRARARRLRHGHFLHQLLLPLEVLLTRTILRLPPPLQLLP